MRKTLAVLAIFPILFSSCTGRDASVTEAETYSLSSIPTESVGVYELSEDELELFARLIAAETEGEIYLAKVSFAAMVLNRFDSPFFPDDPEEVILDAHSFISVAEGRVGRDVPAVPGLDEAKRALAEALSGSDPTRGSLYFTRASDPDPYVSVIFEAGGLLFGI